jgi:hypothetical protein
MDLLYIITIVSTTAFRALVLYIYSSTFYYYHSYLSILSLFLSFFDRRLCQLFVFPSFFFSSLTRENSLFACIRKSNHLSLFLFWSMCIYIRTYIYIFLTMLAYDSTFVAKTNECVCVKLNFFALSLSFFFLFH